MSEKYKKWKSPSEISRRCARRRPWLLCFVSFPDLTCAFLFLASKGSSGRGRAHLRDDEVFFVFSATNCLGRGFDGLWHPNGSPIGRLWGGVRSRLRPQRRCPAFSPDQCLSLPSPMIGEVVIHQSCVFSLCISFVICQFTFSTYVENILLKWSFDSRYDVLFWSGVFWDRRLQVFNGQIFTLKDFVLCAMF